MAAADSTVLLDELLTQAADPLSLPRLEVDSAERLAEGGDGIATWNRLMNNIGRGASAMVVAAVVVVHMREVLVRHGVRSPVVP